MDLCGRRADGGGDVTEGRLKRLSLAAAAASANASTTAAATFHRLRIPGLMAHRLEIDEETRSGDALDDADAIDASDRRARGGALTYRGAWAKDADRPSLVRQPADHIFGQPQEVRGAEVVAGLPSSLRKRSRVGWEPPGPTLDPYGSGRPVYAPARCAQWLALAPAI
jgi:hypothetical protein